MTTEFTPAMRRSILIATLRDKTLWPEGFSWSYVTRSRCAIGLGERLFNVFLVLPGEYFGLTGNQAAQLFNGWFGAQHEVTPEMVADRLEEIHRCLTQEATQ